MKRCLALLTLLALLLALPVGATEAEETPWTRTEGDGSYVTIRIPCPEGNDLLSASRILLSGDDSLKLLSIDGIAPNDAAIADGTYSLSGYNYIALRADEPEVPAAWWSSCSPNRDRPASSTPVSAPCGPHRRNIYPD